MVQTQRCFQTPIGLPVLANNGWSFGSQRRFGRSFGRLSEPATPGGVGYYRYCGQDAGSGPVAKRNVSVMTTCLGWGERHSIGLYPSDIQRMRGQVSPDAYDPNLDFSRRSLTQDITVKSKPGAFKLKDTSAGGPGPARYNLDDGETVGKNRRGVRISTSKRVGVAEEFANQRKYIPGPDMYEVREQNFDSHSTMRSVSSFMGDPADRVVSAESSAFYAQPGPAHYTRTSDFDLGTHTFSEGSAQISSQLQSGFVNSSRPPSASCGAGVRPGGSVRPASAPKAGGTTGGLRSRPGSGAPRGATANARPVSAPKGVRPGLKAGATGKGATGSGKMAANRSRPQSATGGPGSSPGRIRPQLIPGQISPSWGPGGGGWGAEVPNPPGTRFPAPYLRRRSASPE